MGRFAMAKHIFVTGGVVSSLGKGLTCASIGMLLEQRGLRVRLQKFDPYINVDPGTMSPYQHGEVYVLDDGSETDLDLGTTNGSPTRRLTRDCNYTTGKIYLSVIQKEREGRFYEGKTVQVIPHVTDEIKAAIHRLAGDDVDVVITEIGGTVGDIEGLPFLEAIRQFALDVGRENCLYIHLTLVPYLKAAGELKTKPTQHSVGALRQIGIQPDVLICRTEHPIASEDKDKIALFCNVEPKAVIEERDKQFSIYEVPLSLVNHGLDEILVKRLHLKASPLDLTAWREMVERIMHPKHEVRIAVVGKYMKHRDAYKSVYEALDHAGIANRTRVLVVRVEAEEVDGRGAEALLGGRRRNPRPGRLRDARHRRQDRGHPLRQDPQGPVLRHLPGHAVRRRRVRPRRARPRKRQQHRVRPDHRPPRHLADGGTAVGPRARRHDAARLVALRAGAGQPGPRGVSPRSDPRAAPPPLRVQ